MQAVDYAEGHENNAVRAPKICRKRRMGTSTVLSAMEWQQPSRLPTTSSGDICMPACKVHKHQRVSSGLSHLIKQVVWACCVKRNSLSRYAAENRWRKRQQTLKKWSIWIWKSTKGNAMISTWQCFMKIVLELEARWHSDQQKSLNTIHPRVQTVIWQKWEFSEGKGTWG